MTDSVKMLTSQIDELRDATQLLAGRQLDLQLNPVDLVALARRAVERHQKGSDADRFQLATDVVSLTGAWDAGRLERVLDNLLSNATKYSPNDEEITVRTASAGAWAVLTVIDRGIGIREADLPHVFERYWRAVNVSRRFVGSGLGLAGARDIVEQHGGTISVQSVEGQGSTFTVRLPLPDPDQAT
jgi:signal transduction histidine kinase